jgi:hypothetical protein
VGGQLHAPAVLPPGNTRYPLCTRLGVLGAGLDSAETLTPTRGRISNRPARSDSLHRLGVEPPTSQTIDILSARWERNGNAADLP